MTARVLVMAATALLAFAGPARAAEVNLYTYREPGLIKPLLDKFTAETGIKVNTLFASEGLEERIATEGANSPADLLITVDIARLNKAVELGIAQPFNAPQIDAIVPANLRDPAGNWVALSSRARVLYASKDRVTQTELKYEDLADPVWKGKICIRSGQHAYNLALVSAMIAKHGPEKAQAWLEGVKANLARKPSGGDRDVAKDIAAGTCDIGLGNSYYVGLMQKDEKQKVWAEAIKVILPSFADTGGTHVNVSGVVLAKNAPHRAEAVKLAEFLLSAEAQKLYAEVNYEYPVKDGVAVAPTIAAFGTLKADSLGLAEIARNRKAASELVDKVGFDK